MMVKGARWGRVGVVLVVFGALLSGCLNKEAAVFNYKSFIVEYELEGDFFGGESFYVKDGKEARVAAVVSKASEEPVQIRSRIVNDGQKEYYFLGNWKQSEKESESYQKMLFLEPQQRAAYYLSEIILNGAVFNRIGKETVLGRECDLYMVDFGKICVWENIVLKKEVKIGGLTTKMVATNLQLDVPVPDDVFQTE